MKNKKPTSLIAALSLLLPIGVFAQAGSTGSSSSSQYPSTGSTSQSGTSQQSGATGSSSSSQYPSTSSTSQSGSSQQNESGALGSASSQYPSTSSTTQSGASQQNQSGVVGSASSQYPSTSSSTQAGTTQQYPSTASSSQDSSFNAQTSGSHRFKLVSEDKLEDKKLTAENLRGKQIVDRDGQTIGTVKHIGLGSALQDNGRGSNQPYASSSSIGAGAPTGRTSDTTSTSATTSAGGMTGYSSDQGQQVTLYVELDDSVGIDGDDLAAIPASRVSFDSDKEQLKLQLGRSELASQLRQEGGSSSNR